ncbi:MAG TPA: hypothetical protein VK081_03155, partial [Planctomycetota bacterium]|nr:hypothetical protein [Planctomycetota bacterium]
MSSRFLLAGVALFAGAAVAQNKLVTPTGVTNVYGGINNSIPWGPFVPAGNTTGEIMVQQIEDDLVGQTMVIQAMSFRHQYTSTHVAKTFTAQVTLGDAASSSLNISTVFANNFLTGGNQTVVVNGPINFPAVSPYTRPPAQFDSPVIFTTPYTHTGVHPLLWEVIIYQSNPVSPTQFYERGPGTSHTAGWVGTGCTIGGGINPLAANGTTNTTTITNNLANGPASAPAALMVGDASPLFNGVPLPVNLAFLGAPSCDLNINVLAFLNATTDASGAASLALPYTMAPNLSGQRFRTQWVALDGLNVVTSNGLDHCFPYDATN